MITEPEVWVHQPAADGVPTNGTRERRLAFFQRLLPPDKTRVARGMPATGRVGIFKGVVANRAISIVLRCTAGLANHFVDYFGRWCISSRM